MSAVATATPSTRSPRSTDGVEAPLVELDDISIRIGGRAIWSHANLKLAPGTLLAVLGPNGAGKSTLLRVLLGLATPSSGSLTVLGDAPRRGHSDIGYVPQRRALDPELPLRGVDFVRLGLEGDRWGLSLPGPQARARRDAVIRALVEVDAESIADRPIGLLSGGEQQRLFLAQALVGGPRLLLLDEPLASLDVRNQAAIVQLIADVARRRGIAVVMVTHDINPVMSMIDQVMYIARGRVAVGEPEAIIRADVLTALYDTPIDVLTDSRGRVFVVGLENEASHPHGVADNGH
jgi:zinc/manganese transport system ATP-binding protein